MVPSLISASTQMTNVIWQSFAATTASTSSQITNTSVTGASIGVTNAATISVFGLSIAYWKLALAIGAVTFGINFAIMAGAMAVATAEADKQINKLRKDVNGLELSATSTEEAMGFEHSLGKVIVQVGKVADNTSQKISNLNNEILNAGKNSEIKANIEYVVNDKLPEVNQIVNTQVEKEIQLKINDIDKIIQPQTNDILNNIQLQSNNIQMEQLETLVIIKSLISEVNNQLSAVNYIKSIDNGFNITKIIETIVSLVATKQTPITDSINKLNQTKQENNLNDIANYTSETAYDTKKLNELSYINNNTESLKTMDLTKGPLLSSIERSNELLYLIHETLAAKHTLHVAVENTPDIGSEMGKTKSVGNNVQVIINGKFEIRNDLDISKVADEIGNQVMKKMYSTRGRY